MRSFLLWSTSPGAPERPVARTVAARLVEAFAPLLVEPPGATVRESPCADLVFLQLPVAGWKPPFFEEDSDGWALALDYPLNARTVLRSRGIAFDEERLLLRLCRNLENDRGRLLEALAPPFALIWSDTATGEVRFQNDGLGQAQVFEYDDGRVWALTSRIFSLDALGRSPVPDAEQWATRFALGWFPLDMTGYRSLRFVEPGVRIRVDAEGVHREHQDVLARWVVPEALSKQDCLDLARSSVLDMMREATMLWDKPSVGLSGGWDSRALTAALCHLGADFDARVRGNPERYDVMIAHRLAGIAGFPLRIKIRSGMPPETTDGCRESIRRALLWQAGHMPTLKHKTFLSRKKQLAGGVVNVMGQHGGLGKADFAVKIHAETLAPKEYEPRLLAKLIEQAPSFLRADLRERASEAIVQSYRAADRYGLTGLARLHFFFLHEYTRRWSSGSLNSQTGLVFAPYMNPDFIRACYAYPPEELPTKPFHRYITTTLAPHWAGVPYTDQATEEDVRAGRIRIVEVSAKKLREFDGSTPWKRLQPFKKYDYRIYWEDVGRPIVREALASGGFWTEVFEPGMAERQWRGAPDELAIAHLLTHVRNRGIG